MKLSLNPKKVKQLLPGTKDVNFIDECGYTALHYAAENGHTDIVRALLAAGAGINKVGFSYPYLSQLGLLFSPTFR